MKQTAKAMLEFSRILFCTIAVTAAGAWAATEIVEFAVRQCRLSQFIDDPAVIIAVGGCVVAAVSVWFLRISWQLLYAQLASEAAAR